MDVLIEHAIYVVSLLKMISEYNLIRKQNGGVSSARNLGLKKANGNYVCFIDSDDYVSSDYVKKLVQDVEKVSSETLIFHNYNLVGQDLYDNISRVGFFW